MESGDSLPIPDGPDVERALVKVLTEFDERLRRGEPAATVGIDVSDLGGTDAGAAQACLTFLERAFPRGGREPGSPSVERIGRFELVRILGQGGFGVVYLARDPKLGRQVALKVPRLHTLGNAKLHARFLREARAAAALDHPHIVPILETGEVGPVCYIAAAYCEGADLEQWLKSNSPVAPRLAAQIIEKLADATHYSHARGILHRDLKPGNVLLGASPSGGTSVVDELPFVPRIADFGMARIAEEGLGETGSALLGTPLYMAPEQAAGQKENATPATDVYALGVMLYELLTGRPPFQGTGFIEVLDQIRTLEAVPPARLVKSIPRDLETICLKCLAKEPGRRYATAQELQDDLRAFREGRTIVARPAGSVEKGLKWVRRRPLAATLALVVVTAVTSLVVLQWRHMQTLTENLNTTDALRVEALSREAELRLQFNAGEINAAQFELSVGRHNNLSRAARRMDSLSKAETGGGWLAEGLEPEWKFVMRQLKPPPPDLVFAGHNAPVFAVAVAPDRRLIASGDAKGEIKIWSLETGEEAVSIAAHEGEVRALAFSPDGRRLASGGQFRHLKLWDTSSWRMALSADAHEMTITSLDWRPDGGEIASGSRDGKIRLSSAADLSLQQTLDAGAVVNRVRYSSDGTTLYSSDKRQAISKWELNRLPPRRVELIQSDDNPLSLDFSEDGRFGITGDVTFFALDGKRLGVNVNVLTRAAVIAKAGNWAATGGGHGIIDLWRWVDNPLQGVSQQRWWGHGTEGIGGFAATADGSQLITAGLDGLVKVWRIAEFSQPTQQFLNGHSSSVNALEFSRDDRFVASAGDDGRVRVYETADGRLIDTLDLGSLGFKLRMLQFSPDNRTLFVAAGTPPCGLVVWKPGSSIPHEFIPTSEVLSLAMAPDGAYLALGLAQQQGVILWDTATRTKIRTLVDPPLDAPYSQFSPNGRLLAVIPRGTDSNFILLVDVETGARREIPGTTGGVNGLSFDHTGERLLFVSEGHFLQSIDTSKAEVTDSFYLSGPPFDIGRPCFAPDGQAVAIGLQGPQGKTGNIQVFHLGARRTTLTLEPYSFGASQVQYSHDGRVLASITPTPDADGNAGIFLWRFDPPRAPRRDVK